MKFLKLILASSLLALSFTIVGCSSTKKTGTSSTPDDKSAEAQSVSTQNPSSSLNNTVYFDFNKYIIRPDQVPVADAIASALKAQPQAKVQIQGNTDDRGSVEYNMALGTKRANSLKKYLIMKGISADRMSTVSYGKERPAIQGSDESAWAKNRRDDVVEQK